MMYSSEDTSTVKFLVAATCILDTLHVSFMCHTLYYYLVTSYGVPTSLEYIIWSYPASSLMNLLVVVMVQLFFAHKICCLCRHGVRWLVTALIILFVLAHYGFGMVVTVLVLYNNKMSNLTQTWYYSVTPSVATVAVAEVLITVSLYVLLNDGGFYSTCPRAKRLVNTLVTYAANRCLLTLLVVISELVVNAEQLASWTMGLNFIVGKLYTNSFLASLNAREHLRSQGSTAMSILNISALQSADPSTLSVDVGKFKNGRRRFDVCEPADIDITIEPASHKTTMLRADVEV
ncbi:hypothetical protein F5141DRAFT_191227 [Pisolithus sp. B1]|nr:hypothetical protein F5141DRAFT_191227 [Pisolithus sp. B1]